MENYKKKYEEALERAKVINPGTADYEVAVKIFPELKESEDERIRKWLIGVIKSNEYGNISNVGKMPCPKPDVIAWLEKQGEQKCFDILNEEDYNEIETIAMHLENMNNEAMAVSLREILYKHKCKPSTWSEEDERYYDSALWHIKNSSGREGNIYNWLKSLKERIKGE